MGATAVKNFLCRYQYGTSDLPECDSRAVILDTINMPNSRSAVPGTAVRSKVAFFVWRAALLPAAFALCVISAAFGPSAFGKGIAREDGSVPVPVDWSAKHVLFPAGAKPKQAEKMLHEPRVYAGWLSHGHEPEGPGLVRRRPQRPTRARHQIERDWAVSLGVGGVAPGMSPAKYTFDVNATPSCTADFAVFPINASTGNGRAKVVGTFTAAPTAGQTTAITITPTGGAAVTLTLTASAGSNTRLNFQTSCTVATHAANLAAAINRNLSNTALDRVAAAA